MDTSLGSAIPEPSGSDRDIDAFWQDNRVAQEGLLQLVSTKQAFLLVGAGSSCRLKFPAWDEFLKNFYDVLDGPEQNAVRQQLATWFNSSEAASLPSSQELAKRYPLQFATALEVAIAGNGESMKALLGLLDIFAGGWPEALKMIWRLDELYR